MSGPKGDHEPEVGITLYMVRSPTYCTSHLFSVKVVRTGDVVSSLVQDTVGLQRYCGIEHPQRRYRCRYHLA